jgi:hypothetical protein
MSADKHTREGQYEDKGVGKMSWLRSIGLCFALGALILLFLNYLAAPFTGYKFTIYVNEHGEYPIELIMITIAVCTTFWVLFHE